MPYPRSLVIFFPRTATLPSLPHEFCLMPDYCGASALAERRALGGNCPDSWTSRRLQRSLLDSDRPEFDQPFQVHGGRGNTRPVGSPIDVPLCDGLQLSATSWKLLLQEFEVLRKSSWSLRDRPLKAWDSREAKRVSSSV